MTRLPLPGNVTAARPSAKITAGGAENRHSYDKLRRVS